MKTFKELYKPNKKAEGEQKFIAKHVTIKKDDPAGNKDDVFQATNVAAIDRRKDDHGYNTGEDEKVYEEVVNESASKTRADKNYAFHAGEARHYLKQLSAALDHHEKSASEHRGMNGETGPKWHHAGDVEHVHRTLRDIHSFIKPSGLHEGVEEETSLEDEVMEDLLDEFFAALTEEELQEVQALVDAEDDDGLEQYIADNFDRVFEGRDWEGGEWHSQMASKSMKGKVQHHLVKDGKRLSSHDTESQAMAAHKELKDTKGVRIVKEEIYEEEIEVDEGKMYGEPPKGTIAYDRKYGKFTAKGETRKKSNPNTPPEEKKKGVSEGWAEMMKGVADRAKEKGTGEFDKKKISTGTVYQRKPARWDDFKKKNKKDE